MVLNTLFHVAKFCKPIDSDKSLQSHIYVGIEECVTGSRLIASIFGANYIKINSGYDCLFCP